MIIFLNYSFSENDEHDGSIPGDIKEVVPNKATQSSHGKKAKRSASDVRRWLMKKPSINRKKKEKDIKERNSEIGMSFVDLLSRIRHSDNHGRCNSCWQ